MPGTTIYVSNDTSILNLGVIYAVGTPSNPITFTSPSSQIYWSTITLASVNTTTFQNGKPQFVVLLHNCWKYHGTGSY